MKFLSKFWYSSATVKQRWKTLDISISYSLRIHYNWDHLCGVADHFVASESLTWTQAKPVTLNNIVVSMEYGVFLQRGTPRSRLAWNNVLFRPPELLTSTHVGSKLSLCWANNPSRLLNSWDIRKVKCTARSGPNVRPQTGWLEWLEGRCLIVK